MTRVENERLAKAVAVAWDAIADKLELDCAKITPGSNDWYIVWVEGDIYIIPRSEQSWDIWRKDESTRIDRIDADCVSAAWQALHYYCEDFCDDATKAVTEAGYGDLLPEE